MKEISHVEIQMGLYNAQRMAREKAKRIDEDRRRVFEYLIQAVDGGWKVNTDSAKKLLKEWA